MLQEAGGGSSAFVICTAIWLASGASGFFWPIFVALGVLLPLLRNSWRLYGPAPELDRIERDVERDFIMNSQQAKDYGIIDEIIDRPRT